MDVHQRNGRSVELEHAVGTGDAIPAIRDISEHRVSRVVAVESVTVPEDRPLKELSSNGPKKQREVRDQHLWSKTLQRKVDTKIPVCVRIEEGVCKADGEEGRESIDIRTDVVIQRKSDWIILHDHVRVPL